MCLQPQVLEQLKPLQCLHFPLQVIHRQCCARLHCVSYAQHLLHCSDRVNLECQRDISEEEGMLVSAAKTVFASSAPSLWMLAAMLAPPPLVPLIRGLASAFPGKTLSGLFQAYEALYDISACLIQV